MAVTAVDLTDAAFGGLINEDVMQKIWQIDNFPLPLTDRIGSDSHGNAYCEWTTEELAATVSDNAVEDGQVTNTIDDTKLGERIGNHSQISVKVVEVSSRAQASDTIGYQNGLMHQVRQRQRELRQNVESSMLSANPSLKSASSVSPLSAGLAAWIKDDTAVANGTTAGGFNTSTGIVDTRSGFDDGTDVALTETAVRSVDELLFNEGAEATVIMSTPSAIKNFSNYLFTSSARIAALQSDVQQQQSGVVATGAVKVFVADFSTYELVPNRLQLAEGTATSVSVFMLDPSMLRLSMLRGYRVEPLAKTGLADQRQMSVDWSLKCLNPKAQGGVFNVDSTAEATFS